MTISNNNRTIAIAAPILAFLALFPVCASANNGLKALGEVYALLAGILIGALVYYAVLLTLAITNVSRKTRRLRAICIIMMVPYSLICLLALFTVPVIGQALLISALIVVLLIWKSIPRQLP